MKVINPKIKAWLKHAINDHIGKILAANAIQSVRETANKKN